MPIIVEENVDLSSLNTFGVKAAAAYLATVKLEDDMRALIDDEILLKNQHLILGGGSNILLTKDYNGIVLLNRIQGIELTAEDENTVFVRVGAGVNWHEFVMHCLDNSWYGVENLSLIPGNVGASPMQNIGAYGVEIKDVFQELEAIHLKTGEIHYFNRDDCQFGYRESVFKKALKGEYLISRVTYKLSKSPSNLNIDYGAIREELERLNVSDITPRDVSNAVINIRKSKLPDPMELGNSGSFFKNPVVSRELYEGIKKDYPKAVGYDVGDDKVKMAAGWLIENAGWKGHKAGNCGVHDKQALVLVNYGGALGQEVYDLSQQILLDIDKKFGIQLEREVNIY